MDDDALDAMLGDDDLLDAAFDEIDDDVDEGSDEEATSSDGKLAAPVGSLSVAAAGAKPVASAALLGPGLSAVEMKVLEKCNVSAWGPVVAADMKHMASPAFRKANAVPPSASYLMGGTPTQRNRAENALALDVDGLLRAVTADTLQLKRGAKASPLSLREVEEEVAKLSVGEGRAQWVAAVKKAVERELQKRDLPVSLGDT